jgi:hypothetical protein
LLPSLKVHVGARPLNKKGRQTRRHFPEYVLN